MNFLKASTKFFYNLSPTSVNFICFLKLSPFKTKSNLGTKKNYNPAHASRMGGRSQQRGIIDTVKVSDVIFSVDFN